jgi:hypothetical protein
MAIIFLKVLRQPSGKNKGMRPSKINIRPKDEKSQLFMANLFSS